MVEALIDLLKREIGYGSSDVKDGSFSPRFLTSLWSEELSHLLHRVLGITSNPTRLA